MGVVWVEIIFIGQSSNWRCFLVCVYQGMAKSLDVLVIFLIFFFVKTLHSLVDYDEDSDEETGGDEDGAGGSSPAKRQKLDNS